MFVDMKIVAIFVVHTRPQNIIRKKYYFTEYSIGHAHAAFVGIKYTNNVSDTLQSCDHEQRTYPVLTVWYAEVYEICIAIAI